MNAIERATLEAISDATGGRECTPSHPVIQSLKAQGFVVLSDARCGFEKLKDCWVKITDDGAQALTETA